MASQQTSETHYLTQDEVVARLLESISAIENLQLYEGEKRDYATAIASYQWSHKKGIGIIKSASFFDIKGKIEAVVELMPDGEKLSNQQAFKIFANSPTLLTHPPADAANNISKITDLILTYKEMIVAKKRLGEIRDRKSTVDYIASSHAFHLISRSPETIGEYRRYASLCRKRCIQHTSFRRTGGESGQSILLMSVALLEERLRAYDARVARAQTAKPDAAPNRPHLSPEQIKANAAKMMAWRKANKAG